MATKKKLLQAAAGNAGGEALNVEDVFSTYLYDGNGSTQTITNGIDLSGEGGLVWFKNRQTVDIHALFDSERPLTDYLRTNGTNAASSATTNLAFNSNGFSFNNNIGFCNTSSQNYASWTFRKAPKFFDVVTYTGNSTAGRTVSHNLGTDVGFMIIKNTTSSGDWICWHRSASTYAGRILKLNATDAVANNSAMLNNTNPTSTEFTVGTNYDTNGSGQSYVAYLFAHNDGDGEFGPDGDADIIKCGSVSGSSSAQTVDLGFEPQFILYKRADATAPWRLHDVMRGMPVGGNDAYLDANASSAEADYSIFSPTPTGFRIDYSVPYYNTSGGNYIYIAIRRGTAVPESATEVFNIDTYGGTSPNPPAWTSGFPVDMALWKAVNSASYSTWNAARLISGKYLQTAATNAELSMASHVFDYQNGWNSDTGSNSNSYSWMWKRAPKYFDVVAYTGTGSARTVSHNLGVAPEMIWVKERDNSTNWGVYHTGLNGGTTPQDYFIRLNLSGAEIDNFTVWNDTAPTDTQFTVGLASDINGSNDKYIAYLFATLAGISKVGSVTHSGTTNVDCGFSSGARFILLKRTDASGDWYVWDSERGIVSGNDPYLLLNSTAAEVTNTDLIDPLSSGFTITSSLTSGDYIFYAIA